MPITWRFRLKVPRFALAYVLAVFVAEIYYAAPTSAITIPTVPVGNAGNPGDAQPQGIFGGVAYEYRIGTYEVTNAQYAEFLNAKAASDPLGLYNPSAEISLFGGITRSGSSGSFTYATKIGRGDKPVIFVNWYSSVRFANWLNNGQGTGDTETGAYTLLGGTPIPSDAASITRNAGAKWFLPSEDEWYKAAYYDATTSSYFDFATSSDTTPTREGPPGGNNSANSDFVVGDLTDVGAYTASQSPYGTFDQAGNVWEWNEALIDGQARCFRGGSWGIGNLPSFMRASVRNANGPSRADFDTVGFRVGTVPLPGDVNFDGTVDIFDVNLVSAHWGESGPAGDANGDMTVDIFDVNLISANWTPGAAAAVPEPSSIVLCALAAVGLSIWRRRWR